MYDLYEIENIILGMAEIVHENRRLRAELRRASEFEKKYNQLLSKCADNAFENSKSMFDAFLVGCYANRDREET